MKKENMYTDAEQGESKEMNEQNTQSGIRCRLVGENGNIFNLVGLAIRALKRGGRTDLVEPLQQEVFASESYDEALANIMKYVEVE